MGSAIDYIRITLTPSSRWTLKLEPPQWSIGAYSANKITKAMIDDFALLPECCDSDDNTIIENQVLEMSHLRIIMQYVSPTFTF
jgi:hypothetical protein